MHNGQHNQSTYCKHSKKKKTENQTRNCILKNIRNAESKVLKKSFIILLFKKLFLYNLLGTYTNRKNRAVNSFCSKVNRVKIECGGFSN